MAKHRPIRTIVSIVAAITLAFSGTLLGTVNPATALFGDVEIEPIESDITERFWASVEASSGADSAGLAIDQDTETAWAAESSGDQWLTLDLGGQYDNIRKVEVVFPDAGAVYQYVVEASGHGEHWTVIADRRTMPRRVGVRSCCSRIRAPATSGSRSPDRRRGRPSA